MGKQSILKFDPCILAKQTVVGGSLMSIGQRPLNFCFLLTFLKEPHDLVGAPGCNLWQTSNLWNKVNWKIFTRRISLEFSILLTYPKSHLFGHERGRGSCGLQVKGGEGGDLSLILELSSWRLWGYVVYWTYIRKPKSLLSKLFYHTDHVNCLNYP